MTRVGLRVDVDTYRGTREGVPRLLDDLARAGVRASFFFTLGPDRSGRAIGRALRAPGFIAKMVRTNALRLYGLETALYGTLLPAPSIARRSRAVLRACAAAGHEVGLHAWDHTAWQDGLGALARPAIDALLARGAAAFADVFGARPRAFAAPAWICTDDAFEAIDACGFDYASIARGRDGPYFPRVRGRALRTLDVPTTLPTIDEEIGRDGTTPARFVARLVARYRPGADEVVVIHAETEGGVLRAALRDLLGRHRDGGIATVALGDLAAAARAAATPPPARDVALGDVPGRAGKVVLVA